MKLTRLQKLIDKTTKASAEYYRLQDSLNEYCREVYGVEPGDIDADDIIDAIFGGCGIPGGMKAEDFDRIMREGSNAG